LEKRGITSLKKNEVPEEGRERSPEEKGCGRKRRWDQSSQKGRTTRRDKMQKDMKDEGVEPPHAPGDGQHVEGSHKKSNYPRPSKKKAV